MTMVPRDVRAGYGRPAMGRVGSDRSNDKPAAAKKKKTEPVKEPEATWGDFLQFHAERGNYNVGNGLG